MNAVRLFEKVTLPLVSVEAANQEVSKFLATKLEINSRRPPLFCLNSWEKARGDIEQGRSKYRVDEPSKINCQQMAIPLKATFKHLTLGLDGEKRLEELSTTMAPLFGRVFDGLEDYSGKCFQKSLDSRDSK